MSFDVWYHVGDLGNHINSNQNRGMISIHLNTIKEKQEIGELIILKTEQKAFKKIMREMLKCNEGYWIKENTEYKILWYALIGILKNNGL